MAISEELRTIINILIEEGFATLAGELLTEISLGREVEVTADAGPRIQGPADGETFVVREPIPEDQQLVEAMYIVRLRLVEPVRALVEAERIVSELADAPGTRIRFINPEERTEIEPLSRTDIVGSDLADKLDKLLERLPLMIERPTPTAA